MRATCHRASVQRRYCSGVLSLSHVAAMALCAGAAFLPLLLALGSRDFVLRASSYREQPVVGVTDQVLCVLEGERDRQPLTLVHTTFPERVRQLYSNDSLRTASVKTSGTDVNMDGIAESVHLEIATPLSTNEIIRQATVAVVLDYTLKSYAKLNMDVLALYRHSSPFGGDMLHADGDLDLHQRSALDITDSMQHPYIASPIVNMTNTSTTQELLLQSLISGYRERNHTANFHAPYPIWTPNGNSSEDIRVFRVIMDIRVDAVNVLYTPEWPEIVKHAWIQVGLQHCLDTQRSLTPLSICEPSLRQYYCIFVVVSTLAIALREYLFTNKVRCRPSLAMTHCSLSLPVLCSHLARFPFKPQLLPSVCVVDEPRLKLAANRGPRVPPKPAQIGPYQKTRGPPTGLPGFLSRINFSRQIRSMSSKAASEPKTQEEEDLDDLLEDALDDFADEVSAAQASETSSALQEAAATAAATQDSEDNKLQENMAKFLEDAQNPEFQKVLEQAFRELGTDGIVEPTDTENIGQLLGSLKTDDATDETDDVNAGVAKTLQNMAKAAEDMEGVGTAQVEAMGEDMMGEMMKKFEQMGEKVTWLMAGDVEAGAITDGGGGGILATLQSDFQDLVDGMMQQLLSKDVMYDPMKQICERYPEWLAEKEPLLSKEDYERYGKQYQYFQQIVAMYESEPDNYARLSELMQEMQETGQPPSEIVKDLAPGLQFDDEGMPIMPNMGPGMFPGMAGMPGMPLGGAPGQEQCSVM
ncbi:Peroxisome chaperone and import receptor [Phytophthora pseudosyringae]|uniref:Peroxisome chaperone and import receptor n=1 Tax=Phytophthora pseudosyringae TaxID=221518 RepID=A0A8T1VFK5_9STRA|nr:Peroxisome chaperone and import receptor [Phytophthora pseudosyringae]